jgi:hypothetical protein
MILKLLSLIILSTILLNCDQSTSEQKYIEPSKKWIGNWERNIRQNEAGLEIISIKGDSILFILNAGNGGHTGTIEGMAIVNRNKATFYSYMAEKCVLILELMSDSMIRITQKGDCSSSAASGVTFEGVYINRNKISKSEKDTKESMIEIGTLENTIQDSIFKILVGEKYEAFVNTTQMASEVEDIDGLGMTVTTSGIRGLFTYMENIIMIDQNNNIICAVIDDEKVYFYSNVAGYKSTLPKTIEEWRSNFKEKVVVFGK